MKVMARLYKRENVYWVRYMLNGKERRETTGCKKESEAKKFLKERQRMLDDLELHDHLPSLHKDSKFEVLAEKYAKHCEDQKSWKSKKFLVARLHDHFVGRFVSQITKTELERFDKKCVTDNLRGSTINRHLAALSNMLAFGKDEGMVAEKTLSVVRKFKRYDEKKYWRKHHLTREQCVNLLNASKEVGDHLFCAVIVAIFTGLRQCDILKLRWHNIDLDRREISLVMMKTDLEIVLPITDTLHFYLSERRGEQADSELLITWKGKPVKSLRKSFKHACQIAGIKNLRFHDLRHTFASFVARSEPLQVVAKLLGHTTMRMVVRYAHICDEQMVSATGKVDTILDL